MPLVLREHDHKYLDDQRPYLEFVPNSTILKVYFDTFNPKEKAKELAQKGYGKYAGMSEHDILKQWKATSDAAIAYGKLIHSIVEEFILTFQAGKMYLTDDQMKIKVTDSFIKVLPELHTSSYKDIVAERIMDVRVMETKYAIAGTSDIVYMGKPRKLWDIKTGKKPIEGHNPYNEFCQPPLQHIPATYYYKYQAQLGVYSFMIYKETGEWPEETGILWWDEKNMKFELINIPIDRKTLTTMIRHYFKLYQYEEHKGISS
jgi:hypothetical protein